MIGSRNFWAIGIPRILSEPAWQTFNAWIPLYMMTERHMNLKEIALFAWMPFLAADIGCVLGGYLSPLFHKYAKVSLFTSRKMVFVFGALCMVGPACVGLVASPYAAIALLCVGGFAHQTLSGALYAITSDVFGKNEVATATGMGGMAGYLGAAAFTALFGVLGHAGRLQPAVCRTRGVRYHRGVCGVLAGEKRRPHARAAIGGSESWGQSKARG